MNEQNQPDEKYAGPPKAIEVLGKGNAYGWIGSIGGAVVGGLWAAIATKETNPRAQALTEWFGKHNIQISGKAAIMGAGALVASQIAHWVTYAIGIAHGEKTSGKGQAQFTRIKAELSRTKAELEALKSEREAVTAENIKAVDSSKDAQREEAKPSTMVHANELEAQKETMAEIAR